MGPFEILEELLRWQEVPRTETHELSRLTHNEVCILCQERIEWMLGSFQKYAHVPYFVQGPRDQGVDVLYKMNPGPDTPQQFVGLQIKSHREIAEEPDLVQKLKAGVFDTKNMYGDAMRRCYLLLAGDAHKQLKRIAATTNEFAKDSVVRVVKPEHVLGFLRLEEPAIASIVDLHLRAEDAVRKKARREVARYSDAELFIILACVCWVLENSSDKLPQNFFSDNPNLREAEARYGWKIFSAALSKFSDTDFETYAEPASTRVRLEHFEGVRALYFDLQVRYDERADGLFKHLFKFLALKGSAVHRPA